MCSQLRLGVIGYGVRARHMAQIVCSQDPSVRLTAVADPQADRVREEILAADPNAILPRFYADADQMLSDESLDGVIIGTRCSLHAKMAVKVMQRDIALLLEKPVATTLPDLMTLRANKSSRVVVSFPLRVSRIVRLAKQIIDSGKIGAVEHVQSWNNVPYGNVYFQTWYRDEAETQGLFLQKATHDLDYINFLLGDMRPRFVSAMTSKRVFHGEHPAGLRCMDCPERKVCHESPYHPARLAPIPLNQPAPEMCAFAVDTGNEDSGSALIEYESGMHVAYSQNFYARNKAARRGATLIGYDGTIEFDWYPERLKVYLHHSDQMETHEFGSEQTHGGGDAALAANFVGVMRGDEESVTPLEIGLMSALMCLKAKESAASRRFQAIEWPDAGIAQERNGAHERERDLAASGYRA